MGRGLLFRLIKRSTRVALSPFVRPRGVRLVCLRHHIWEQRGVTSGGVKVDRLHGSDIKSAKKTLHQDNFYQKEGIFHRILASTTPENAEGHHKSIRIKPSASNHGFVATTA